MNNDLISRDVLKKAIKEDLAEGDNSVNLEYCNAMETALDIIDNAPTVCGNNPKWCENCVSKGKYASTRPQGEWGKHGECPFCSYIRQWEEDNFCGNCGADLRGKYNDVQ